MDHADNVPIWHAKDFYCSREAVQYSRSEKEFWGKKYDYPPPACACRSPQHTYSFLSKFTIVQVYYFYPRRAWEATGPLVWSMAKQILQGVDESKNDEYRRPTRQDVVNWVSTAWKSITVETLIQYVDYQTLLTVHRTISCRSSLRCLLSKSNPKKFKRGITTVGLQVVDSKIIWELNKNTHIDENGYVIPLDESGTKFLLWREELISTWYQLFSPQIFITCGNWWYFQLAGNRSNMNKMGGEDILQSDIEVLECWYRY